MWDRERRYWSNTARGIPETVLNELEDGPTDLSELQVFLAEADIDIDRSR